MTAMNKLLRILRHRWLDSRDSRRLIPDDMALRLSRRITASEARHSGEIRLCVEAALPLSYLWRLGNGSTVRLLAREPQRDGITNPVMSLSPRELQVFELIGKGLSGECE